MQNLNQSESSPTCRGTEIFERNADGKPRIPLKPDSIYAFGYLIRRTEELLLRLFGQGLLSGTTHTCLGQELCQMAVVRALNDADDIVVSNHRNHGHFLTYSGDFLGLISEIMGRAQGVCKGVGGSQHLAYRGFHSNGVQAGMTAIGTGYGLALKMRGSSGISVVIVGDGTLGQGLLYESMNLASIWNAPVLFVVENNGIAQTTDTKHTIGGTIEGRGAAFGLRTCRTDDTDPRFFASVEEVVTEVRTSRKPNLLVIETKRMGPHSKGDDLRAASELDQIRTRDPLACLGALLSGPVRAEIEVAADNFIKIVHQTALHSMESQYDSTPRHVFASTKFEPSAPALRHQGQNVRASLNNALHTLLEESPDVVILGEDLHDPYGGAFKVTAGLNTRYPDRVLSTPISEAGVVGAAIGLAMAGFRPIVEIMFADFITLAFDQIYNHAVKFPAMFSDVSVPLVIRTPCGGRRGYGPTHSQSPENLLVSVPGLTVVFPSHRHDPGELLRRSVCQWPYPTIFLEHKILYGRPVDPGNYREAISHLDDPGADAFPTLVAGSDHPDITFVCYGDSVNLVECVVERLKEEEIEVEIVVPSLISPLPKLTLNQLLLRRKRILVLEEAPAAGGFGAELSAVLLEAGFRGKYARVAPPCVPIPAARSLEFSILPNEDTVMDRVIELFLAELS